MINATNTLNLSPADGVSAINQAEEDKARPAAKRGRETIPLTVQLTEVDIKAMRRLIRFCNWQFIRKSAANQTDAQEMRNAINGLAAALYLDECAKGK